MSSTNVLDDQEKVQLWAWLKSMEKEILAEKPVYHKLAERASRELYFKVTSQNIESAVRIGVIPRYSEQGGHMLNKGLTATRLNRHEEIISKLEERIAEIERKLQTAAQTSNRTK